MTAWLTAPRPAPHSGLLGGPVAAVMTPMRAGVVVGLVVGALVATAVQVLAELT